MKNENYQEIRNESSSVVKLEGRNISDIEEENVTVKKEEKEKQGEDENINKKNATMTCMNFKIVMKNIGRVIINLGFIYFFQFLCVNCVLVKVCSKANISFLPEGCAKKEDDAFILEEEKKGLTYLKGQFEFINIFFQLGMFISKTLIKVVRKIHPIEVYTIVISLILFFYFIEYFFVFCHWGYYIPITLVLGFFSGGTYAGGFYTILNSEKVTKNFKELSVNIATLFNDLGTFLSGLIGLLLIKTLLNDETKGRKYIPKECTVNNNISEISTLISLVNLL